MDTYEKINRYRNELKHNPHLDPALYWAGKMANLGKRIISVSPLDLEDEPQLLNLVIDEYNHEIIERVNKQSKKL